MTKRVAEPKPQAERNWHDSRCIREFYIDVDEVAKVMANAYDAEPDSFDYEVAMKLVELFKTFSLRGQVVAHFATGMSPHEIAQQLRSSSKMVKQVLSDEGLI